MLRCTGLGPFGYPPFPAPCPDAARFYVWPETDPPTGSYGYLCAAHLAQLQALRPVYQTTDIRTGETRYPQREGVRMAKIEIAGFEATITNYKWTCPESPELEGLLNARLPSGGPSGSDPNPDRTAAMNAVKFLGGEVIDPGPDSAFDPQVIY